MRNYLKLIFVLFILISGTVNAQSSRFMIQLNNKNGSPYSLSNPIQFLTQRSIDRKTKYNIVIDSTDLPVIKAYVDSIRLSGAVTILNISKWNNQVYIQTTDANALNKINSFPFVSASKAIALRLAARSQANNSFQENLSHTSSNTTQSSLSVNDYYSYGQGYAQINLSDGEFLHNHGFRGEGKIMAITDAGFTNYTTIPFFDSIRTNNQILGTWDFVTNDTDVSVYEHGTNCLSTIASNIPGSFVGTAPKASFYLYCSEYVPTEYHVEEYNWICAAEKADSLGVDVISISLGYLDFDDGTTYTYNDMNGHTTVIAKGVNIAARKGILVVAANGNFGNGYSSSLISNYNKIATPADADSVMAVGAVNTSGQIASFSSHGPNSSGQVKPDVAAVGWNAAVADPYGNIVYGNGTSFACPIIAGLSTCLWEAFPEVNNMKIIDAFRKSANMYSNPDTLMGYGIPDMKKAFVTLINELHTASDTISSCKAIINWSAKSDSTMNFMIERKLQTEIVYKNIFTQSFTGGFIKRNCTYADDLSSLPPSTNIQYRIIMNIGSDTSFYLDSFIVNFQKPNLGSDKSVSTCPDSSISIVNLFSTSNYLNTSWTLNNITVANPASVTTPGIYQLIVSNNFGCTDTALITLSNDPQLCPSKITVSPNPVSDQLSVVIVRTYAVHASIIVYNSLGQKVYALENQQAAGGENYSIPMNNLASGVYFVYIKLDGEKVIIKKIVKQ